MTSSRLFPTLILLACAGALAAALTTQYGFGLKPCVLCIYQRIPYAVAGVLAAISLLPTTPPKIRWRLVALCALAFVIDGGIAVFHVGVEHHWWAGLAACTGGAGAATSVESLKAMLAGPPPVPCDQIPWELFGISMAGYNIILAFTLALFAGWTVPRLRGQA